MRNLQSGASKTCLSRAVDVQEVSIDCILCKSDAKKENENNHIKLKFSKNFCTIYRSFRLFSFYIHIYI